MMQKSGFLFLYHTLWVLLLNTWLAGWGFFFFIPFLIQKIYLSSPESCIRAAFFCGFLLDICSGLSSLGLFAISYALLILLLRRVQPYLIEEKIYSLCILSGISTIFLLVLLPFLGLLVGSPIMGGTFSAAGWLDLLSINMVYTLVSLGPFWWKKRELRC